MQISLFAQRFRRLRHIVELWRYISAAGGGARCAGPAICGMASAAVVKLVRAAQQRLAPLTDVAAWQQLLGGGTAWIAP